MFSPWHHLPVCGSEYGWQMRLALLASRLSGRYADRAVRSVFIYTREAHPGENYPAHAAMDDKRHHARAFKAEFGLKRMYRSPNGTIRNILTHRCRHEFHTV